MKQWFLLPLMLFTVNCSQPEKKSSPVASKTPYVMPPNPFPTIMEQFYSYELPVNRIEIVPQSLSFGCTKRNDAELYWCSITAEIKHPDKTLPSTVSMVTSYAISPKAVKLYRSDIKRFKKSSGTPLFLLGIFPFESRDGASAEILGKYYGIYNKDYCLNWYGYYEDCPKGAVKVP